MVFLKDKPRRSALNHFKFANILCVYVCILLYSIYSRRVHKRDICLLPDLLGTSSELYV